MPKLQLLPLTGIRFFLALWVVVFHQASSDGYLETWIATLPAVFFCLLRTGYMGVGLFFVLSGFILSYNYPLDQRWQPAQLTRFAVARFARIYPAYCVGLLLFAPFVVFALIKNPSPANVGKEMAVATLNWTLLQSWIPQTALSWNSPGWSLSNEAFFYCCFPFAGVAIWRCSSLKSLLAIGLVIWGASLVAPLAAVSAPIAGFGNVPATSSLPAGDPFWCNLIKFNPLLRLPEFCVGILLGRAYYYYLGSRNTQLLGRGYWLYVPGIFLELVATANGNTLQYPLAHNGLLLPLHSLVILGFALGGGAVAQFLSLRSLVFLGNASYSMYILHFPIEVWMNSIGRHFFHLTLGGVGITLLYVLIVICLSSLVFLFIEEPANRVIKKKLTSWLGESHLTGRRSTVLIE